MAAYTITPFAKADAAWIAARHGALYAQDEGFDASFPGLVAQILADFCAHHDPKFERGWVAWRDPEPDAEAGADEAAETRRGCIFVVRQSAQTPRIAKLRLVLVEPEARGTGLAQRLLDTAMDFARDAGYSTMRLWTHQSHVAAGRLYARNGFSLIESEPMRAFGQDVVSQIWQREL